MLSHNVKSIYISHSNSSPETVVMVDMLQTSGNLTITDTTVQVKLAGSFQMNTPELTAALVSELQGSGFEGYFQ